MTKMPLNSSISLKHLFKPLNTRFYPRNKYKRKEKGVLNVNIYSAIKPPNLTFARPRAKQK